MGIFALWSAPRARSTAFFRSMAERGDFTVLHEPFSNLKDYGETDVDGQTSFARPAARLATRPGAPPGVFLKDTMDHQHDAVLADRRFLAEARHAFLLRRPEEIAAPYYALFPPMTINAIGMDRLCEMRAAIGAPGGPRQSSLTRMTLWPARLQRWLRTVPPWDCPSIPARLPGSEVEQTAWRRSARWHTDASLSSGFKRREREYPEPVENCEKLARYAAHHRPFDEELHAHRLDVRPWERPTT